MNKFLEKIINLFSKIYTVLLLPHGTHARVDVDLFLRALFGFYYVPIVLYILLVSANVSLQFVFVTLLPTVQDLPLLNSTTTQLEAYSFLEQGKRREMLDLILHHGYFWIAEVFTALLPHATLFFCLMALMHKLVTSSGEATVDTMSYYRGLDYPLLHATVKMTILVSWKRRLLSFIVGGLILYGAWRFASDFILHVISTRPTSVLAAVIVNVIWCFSYLSATFVEAFLQNRREQERKKKRAEKKKKNKFGKNADFPDDSSIGSSESSNVSSASESDDEESDGKEDSEEARQRRAERQKDNASFWSDFQWLQSRFGFMTGAYLSPFSSYSTLGKTRGQDNNRVAASKQQKMYRHRAVSEEQLAATLFLSSNSPTDALTKSTAWVSRWWRHHVNYIRHISISCLLFFMFFWVFNDGPLQAFRFFVETLIALNVPNFCIYLTLKIVVAVIRGYSSFRWLIRHRQEGWLWVVLVAVIPHSVLIIYTASVVSSTIIPLVSLFLAFFQVFARAAVLCREEDVSGNHIVWSTILVHHRSAHDDNDGSSPHQNPNSSFVSSALASATISPTLHSLQPSSGSFHNSNNNSNPPSPTPDALEENALENLTNFKLPTGILLDKAEKHAKPKVTKRRIAPAVAALLENAHECGYSTTTEVVSLETEADLNHMQLFKRGLVLDLVREVPSAEDEENSNTNNQQKKVPILATALKLFTKLVLFQSGPSFSGARFQIVRTVLRTLTGTLLAIFVLLVLCLVAQESMEILRPLPLGLECLEYDEIDKALCTDLKFDHFFIQLRLTLKNSKQQQRAKQEQEQEKNNKNKKISSGPICDILAVPSRNLHIWELSWLALVPYLDNMQNVTTLLKTLNKAVESDWEILPFSQQQCSPLASGLLQQSNEINTNVVPPHQVHGISRRARQPWRAFMRMRSKSRNVTSIAIRGTDPTSVLDALQDVDMYLESVMWHVMSNVIPGLRLLPLSIVKDLIHLSSSVWPADGVTCIDRGCERDAAVASERRYYEIVLRFINTDAAFFKEQFPSDTVILNSHSLGAAIGSIVAGRSPLVDRTIGFAAPGIELSMYKFGIDDIEKVRAKSTTVVPDNDVVPMIGGQIGHQVPLRCFDQVQERCHAMEAIISSLWQMCKGDELFSARFPNVEDVSLM